MLYVDGWDGMVIIVHRSFKSTLGANKCSDNKGCSCGELVHFCQLASTSLSPKSRPEKRWGGHQELPSFLQSSSKSLPFGSWVQPLPSAIVFASICPYTNAYFIHNSSLFNESCQKEYSGQSSAETSSFENLYLPSNNDDCAKRSSLSERVFKWRIGTLAAK